MDVFAFKLLELKLIFVLRLTVEKRSSDHLQKLISKTKVVTSTICTFT